MDQESSLKRIAIVDDDALVREALQDSLESAGYTVESHASAEDFLAAGYAREIACLILDIRLPGMSGIELQSRLNGLNYEAPIIFVTALANNDGLRDQAMRQGAKAFLTKPVRREDLLSSIRAAAGPRQMD